MAMTSQTRTESKERVASYGRGGAGNFKSSPRLDPVADLATPHIKSLTYTTGRGGTGNMASNDPSNPSLARAAQDVEAPKSALKEPENSFRFGRGGAANVAKLSEEETKINRGRNAERLGDNMQGGVGVVGKAKEVMENALGRVRTNEDKKAAKK